MDIQINVNIGLTKGLEQFLTTLLGGQAAAPVRPTGTAGALNAESTAASSASATTASAGSTEANLLADPASSEQPTDGGQEGENPTKRTRRTKAQIEADNAAAQGTPQSSDPSNGSDETVDLLSGAAAGPTATTDASPSDLAAALEQVEAPAGNGAVTKEMVAAKMGAAMGIEGLSPKKIQDKMVADLDGAKNMSTLKPELYPAALALFEKIIADGGV